MAEISNVNLSWECLSAYVVCQESSSAAEICTLKQKNRQWSSIGFVDICLCWVFMDNYKLQEWEEVEDIVDTGVWGVQS